MRGQHFNTKAAAIIITTSTIMSLALILNHPTIGSHELSKQLMENASEIGINNFVHGSLIALLIANGLAFTIYSLSRKILNISVLGALILYTISTLLMILAALMNGFIYPSFLQDIATHQPDLVSLTPMFRVFSWNINQSLANASVLGTSLAIILWSINLFHTQYLQKLVALTGISTGLTMSVSILFGWLELNLFGMTLVICFQGFWNLTLAYLLFFKKIQSIGKAADRAH